MKKEKIKDFFIKNKILKENTFFKKIIGTIFIMIGLSVIGIITFFIFLKFFSAPHISTLLPEKEVVALVEADISTFNGQYRSFIKLISSEPIYDKQGLINNLYDKFKIDFYQDINPWLGGKIGVAILKRNLIDKNSNWIFFIETFDKEKTIKFMNKLAMIHPEEAILKDNYGDYDIFYYKLSNNLKFFFAKGYIIISPNREVLTAVIDVLNKKNKSLDETVKYRDAIVNTSNKNFIFAFIDLENTLNEVNLGYLALPSMLKEEIGFYYPFLKIFNNAAITIGVEKNALKIDNYISIDKNRLKNTKYFVEKTKYQGNLLKYLDGQKIAYFGGQNIGGNLNNFEKIFEELEMPISPLFKGEINRLFKIYLDINNENEKRDILNLLKNEYLIYLDGNFSDLRINLLLEIEDKKNAEKIIKSLKKAFVLLIARKNPIKREVILEDQTKGQELAMDFSLVTEEKEIYKNIEITKFFYNQKFIFAYLIEEKFIAFSSDLQNIKNLIDQKEKKTTSDLDQNLIKILKKADEISMINLQELWAQAKFIDAKYIQYLMPLKFLYQEKQTFDNGITSEYYLYF